MDAVNLLTQAQYAAHRGVSRAAVSKAVTAGRITLKNGKVDQVAADAQWARNSRMRIGYGIKSPPAAVAPVPAPVPKPIPTPRPALALASAPVPPPPPPPPPPAPPPPPDLPPELAMVDDYGHSRARREQAEADLAEMRREEERGMLIRVDAVRAVAATTFASTRDALLQIPSRVSQVLAAETDPSRVHDTLQTELHQALAQLSSLGQRIGEVRPP